ncbi:hypothetical protein FSP39_019419 [Pinctada imbricata]|uniref:Uncharacterized protein n=1 Tax=Pinctada imbricata TaxID=66713 RepID=A0AA89C200_PINIB|nr:hypothetical protein FSP39_019419 [Pinctada imbricata]
MADIDVLLAGLAKFKFFFIRLRLGCNGVMSCPLTEAKCNPELIFAEDENLPNVPVIVRFSSVFRRGFEVLHRNNKSDVRLDEKAEIAANVLQKYMTDKEKHAKCLNSILGIIAEMDNVECKKTILAEALAVHLLGPLCPSQSFIINENCMKNGGKECRCGCKTSVAYGATGIGNEEVWHGFADIMLLCTGKEKEPFASATVVSDNHQIPGSSFDAVVIPAKRQKMDYDNSSDEEEGEEEIPGKSSVTEINLSTSDPHVIDQALAQTIVFASLQRQRHPSFHNHLIPNIVISSHHFRVVMYDAELDVLICSDEIPIFFRGQLLPSAIKALWLVLHYEMFCTGIPGKDGLLEEVTSKFRQRVQPKLNMYDKELKVGVSSFPFQKEFSTPKDNEVCDFIDWEHYIEQRS